VYTLYIANKNYSSWSLRPWVLMRELRVPFREHLLIFGDAARWKDYERISPTARVPCLVDGDLAVWDSLAITEYLAERHPAVWPQDTRARSWARSVAAEMHSGFTELRAICSMSCGVRMRVKAVTPALQRDIDRLSALWSEGLRRFGGPFLAGAAFTGADAFYAPVAFRIQTYGLTLEAASAAYAERLLGLESMREWYASALQETWRDETHDIPVLHSSQLLQDLRAGAPSAVKT
jgi:glutathione S-transferase